MGIVLAIDFIEFDSKNIIGNMKKILTKQKQSMKYWREWTQERLPLKMFSDQADKKTYAKGGGKAEGPDAEIWGEKSLRARQRVSSIMKGKCPLLKREQERGTRNSRKYK